MHAKGGLGVKKGFPLRHYHEGHFGGRANKRNEPQDRLQGDTRQEETARFSYYKHNKQRKESISGTLGEKFRATLGKGTRRVCPRLLRSEEKLGKNRSG